MLADTRHISVELFSVREFTRSWDAKEQTPLVGEVHPKSLCVNWLCVALHRTIYPVETNAKADDFFFFFQVISYPTHNFAMT